MGAKLKKIFFIPTLTVILTSALILIGTIQSGKSSDLSRLTLRIGLSTEVVESDVNPNDALAATQTWANNIRGATWEDTESMIFPDLEKTKELLDNKRIEVVALATHEYIQNAANLAVQPSLAYVHGGEVDLEYILLVHKDSKIEKAEDLEGKRLALPNRGRYCLAPIWLDVYLMQNHLPGKAISLGERRIVNKASQAILPVFFGQMDAAVVVRSALNIAIALNPQIGNHLKILACSPRFVPIVVCLRESLTQTQKSGLIQRALRLHETPSGLQTFTVFKMDRIVSWQKNYETGVKHLMDEHEKLIKETLKVSLAW